MDQREIIRSTYPAILTLADVTEILRISKRKAAWLLQHGYIKNKNSGKKTRQYKIKIDALLNYMDQVARNDPAVYIPSGIFSSKLNQPSRKKGKTKLTCPSKRLPEKFKLWLSKEWIKTSEILTIKKVSTLTGYSTTTVQKWMSTKKLKSIAVDGRKIITTKEWLIYTLCNTDHPVGYNGHSMSVGDVVELEDGSCHFCDSFGFKELKDFDTSKVAPIVGHRMLVIEPHKAPYEMTIPDGLDPLQQAVKGYIEATYPFDDNAFIIGNV